MKCSSPPTMNSAIGIEWIPAAFVRTMSVSAIPAFSTFPTPAAAVCTHRSFLAARSSTDEGLAVVGRTNRGFVYAASTMGVTGPRDTVSNRAEELVARMRKHTDLPIGVGLGVSNGAQAAEVAAYADAVIVGSAFVRALQDEGTDGVRRLAEDLAQVVRQNA